MSMFTSVDSSSDPSRAISYLEWAARADWPMKHYVTAAHERQAPPGPVLDLGCGAGHDLALFDRAGMRVVGIDPSAVMLAASRERMGDRRIGLVQAVGENLPFADASFAGCRIERVLMHVVEPVHVLTEAARCLRTGSLITAFEPDWSSFKVRSDRGMQPAAWIANVRHPDIGATLWGLLEGAGCQVVNRVEQLSVWRSLSVLESAIGLSRSIPIAVEAGRISQEGADHWHAEQRRREANGSFYAEAPRVLIVARKRDRFDQERQFNYG